MAASFTIAARNNGFSQVNAQAATLASVRAYRDAMATFAQMPTMDIWYAHLDEDELRTGIRNAVAGAARQEEKPGKAGKKAGRKAGKEATLRPGLRPEGVALRAVRLTGRDEPGTVGGWLMTSAGGTGIC